MLWAGDRSRYSDYLRAGRSGDRSLRGHVVAVEEEKNDLLLCGNGRK